MGLDLSVIIPARQEAENLRALLPRLHRTLEELAVRYEILVINGGSTDETAAVSEALGARVVTQTRPGYGSALREGFDAARGRYIVTMDADLSHEPRFVTKLWAHREAGEVVIASRYTKAGVAYMPWVREALSRILNRAFTWGLCLDVRDISSGFRLYDAAAVRAVRFTGTDFNALPEIVLRMQAAGWRIREVPFTYFPRHRGSSQARIVRVGVNLAKTFLRMWRLRNSIEAADYDERAFYSVIPPQRMWQRRRHRIITHFARQAGRTLDVGCGSSVILQSLNDAIGMDIKHTKMRYMSRYGMPVVTGSAFALPFVDASMKCLISSEVIEHVPVDAALFTEMDRVLQPGGLLILGTPDYGTVTWPVIEWFYHRLAPGGYADEHISHYTRRELHRLLEAMGYDIEQVRYVYGGEMIFAARKRRAGALDPDAVRARLPGHAHAPTAKAAREPRPSGRGEPVGVCMLASKFYAESDMGGGLERSARCLIRELQRSGHRVFVLTRNYDGLPRRAVIDGAAVERLPVWGRWRPLVSASFLVQALAWLIRHRRDYQLIHCHQAYAPAVIGALAKLLLRKPVLVKISTSDEFSERRQLEQLGLVRLRKLLLRQIDRVIVVNRMAAQEFAELGVAPSRIAHIPNGVVIPPHAAFDQAAKEGARARLGLSWRKLAVFVGRLSSEKNLSTLLAGWPSILQQHPDAGLVLVGDGGTFRNVEPLLRRQVKELGVQASVLFTGRVHNVQDYLLAGDVFVLPSSTEGMSNALLEAMASGLAIVATGIPGNQALIEHGHNGVLVEPRDERALAAAISRLLESPEEAARLGRSARRIVEDRFAIGRVHELYQQLYQDLVIEG